MNTGNNQTSVHVFPGGDEMADFMVQKWCETASLTIKRNGFFCAALSGGHTPVEFYNRLAGLEDISLWNNTHIFLADERCVPPDHDDSNYRLLRNTFLDRVPVPSQNIHAVPVEPSSAEVSAVRYELVLTDFFGLSRGMPPRFDLILLGIGEDGHTASLFPGSEAVKETEHLTASVPLDKRRHDRVTLTLPVINSARNVAVLLSGDNKCEIAERVIEARDASLPASLVRLRDGRLIFLLDSKAASKLSIGRK
ncbi:MAG: 6-phosphogluconolactonase [Candidatus Sulfobium sp.]|jgi:6-phosphogluconolactonase